MSSYIDVYPFIIATKFQTKLFSRAPEKLKYNDISDVRLKVTQPQ